MEHSKVTKLQAIKNQLPITFAYGASYEAPENFSLHINQYYEIYVYIKGDTDYVVGDSYFTLKSGDMIIINPYEIHKPVLKSTNFYERFFILIPTETFQGFSFNPLQSIITNTVQKKNLLFLPEEQRQKALSLLYQISDSLNADSSKSGQIIAFGMLLQFITLISNYTFESAITHADRLPCHISDALKYINENLTQLNSVEELASHLGISAPYLSTTFKNAIGTPAIKYIQTKKIAYAKSLLDKDYSVTEACYESGFNDSAYFIKIFKQHVGVTPLQYKKNFKNLSLENQTGNGESDGN